MTVLILTDKDRDYAADYLCDGFCKLVGAQNVVDFPRKPSLHWAGEPVMDCDLDLNTALWNQLEVEAALRDGKFKLIVVPTIRGIVPQRLYFWRELLRRNADRIVYYDGEDHACNTATVVTEIMGFKPTAYFKRELPIGETWAYPLPFGYPAERIIPIGSVRRANYVGYCVELWMWARGGLRERIAMALNGLSAPVLLRLPEENGRGERFLVKEYHSAMRNCSMAISPSGRGYHTNRHLEIVADGCCPIIERPWMQWPNALIDGAECRYFANEMDCVDIVRELIEEPEQVHAMAQAAQKALVERHSTLCRAKTVMEAIHGR